MNKDNTPQNLDNELDYQQIVALDNIYRNQFVDTKLIRPVPQARVSHVISRSKRPQRLSDNNGIF